MIFIPLNSCFSIERQASEVSVYFEFDLSVRITTNASGPITAAKQSVGSVGCPTMCKIERKTADIWLIWPTPVHLTEAL